LFLLKNVKERSGLRFNEFAPDDILLDTVTKKTASLEGNNVLSSGYPRDDFVMTMKEEG